MDLKNIHFKNLDIPVGRSELEIDLPAHLLTDGDPLLKRGKAFLEFFKTEYFTEVKFNVSAIVELVCYRSLETFEFTSESEYKVLFKEGASNIADEHVAERSFSHNGETIDLTYDLRDSILLSLPAQPLHPRFLDEAGQPIEFQVQRFGDIDLEPVEQDLRDPRWTKLKELKEKLSETDSIVN